LLALIAVMVTVLDDGMVTGAVKRPPSVMVPVEADQVALAVAVNCCLPPSATLAVEGLTLKGMLDANGTVMIFENSEPGFLTFTG
jgi:hypothetical protein